MSSAAAWWIEKIGPGAIAGVVSLVGIGWVQRKTAKQFTESNALAREGQRIQKDQFEKVLRVERHAEAYRRWRLIYWFDRKHHPESFGDFLNEMNQWLDLNRLYLSEGAARAFSEASRSRALIELSKGDPAEANANSERVVSLEQAGKAILAASPRWD